LQKGIQKKLTCNLDAHQLSLTGTVFKPLQDLSLFQQFDVDPDLYQ